MQSQNQISIAVRVLGHRFIVLCTELLLVALDDVKFSVSPYAFSGFCAARQESEVYSEMIHPFLRNI